MWFTKDVNGFRGWFPVALSNGSLRTGLVAGDFTVTVVDSADGDNFLPTVSESTQKPGLYYFDIDTTFLTSNGVGDYGILVQVDTFAGPSGGPNVRASFGGNLKVSEKDFDDIVDAAAITDIQTALSNVENIVTNIESDVGTIFSTLISQQFTISADSNLSGSTFSTGVLDFPAGFFDGQLVVLVSNYGTAPVILARSIADYAADGTITVDIPFPFVPNDGDQLIVLARSVANAVNNNAIAQGVWTIVNNPATPGTYGELVNIIGSNASLIPGLV
jgi:hypothetical protein